MTNLTDKVDLFNNTQKGGLIGAVGIAGGLTAKQMGMFSYMTAKYSDSKKPKNWGKLGKYDRSKLGK
jgi:hypothetical protein